MFSWGRQWGEGNEVSFWKLHLKEALRSDTLIGTSRAEIQMMCDIHAFFYRETIKGFLNLNNVTMLRTAFMPYESKPHQCLNLLSAA